MAQNISQFTATGSYSDLTTADITSLASWTVSDTSIATVGAGSGIVTIATAGKIWGGDIGVTATLAPGTPGTASILVISSDSGSIAPLMPQQNNHWQALGLPMWGTWFGCQESTGNLVGSGSAGYTMTATAAGGQGVMYGQAVTGGGWTRTAIMISGTISQRVVASSGTGPNSVLSMAQLGYVHVGPSQTNVCIMGLVGSTNANKRMFVTDPSKASSGFINISSANVGKSFIAPFQPVHSDRVHPYLVAHDFTNSITLFATDIGVYVTGGDAVLTADGDKGFGVVSQNESSSSFVYYATITGSLSELYSTTSGAADLLARLGWRVAWKDCPIDSGSIYCPYLPSHWYQIGQTPWTATWNCQENQGVLNSFDKWIGVLDAGYALSNVGSVTYSNVTSGWNRTAVGLIEASSQRFTVADVAQMLFDPTGSMALLAYITSSAVAGSQRSLFGVANNSSKPTCFSLDLPNATAGAPVLYCAGATATGTTNLNDGKVHAVLIVYDKTNSRAKLYTDFEKLTGSFNALSLVNSITASLGLGGMSSTICCGGRVHYFTFTTGTSAENYSDDGKASQLFKQLGWNISW